MKENGFTLIELLAVIVILAIIFSIVTISVGKTINDSEKKLSTTQKNIIEHAAEMYYIEEGRNNKIACVSLNTLIDKGYLKANQVKDPQTKGIMDGSVKITIDGKKYSYEYIEDFCGICKRVTESTTGNVPTGSFNYGDEYKCKVGDNYTNTFFVLENNTDTVSLIMKENYTDSYVPKTTAWCTDGGTSNKTCKNITATGSNASTGKDYLGHIKSIFNKEGVTVSFPSASQIAIASGKTFNNSGIYNLPTWLYDYLSSTTHPVSGVNGYWTTTPQAASSTNAWYVSNSGNVSTGSINSASVISVRPVITLSKSDIQ